MGVAYSSVYEGVQRSSTRVNNEWKTQQHRDSESWGGGKGLNELLTNQLLINRLLTNQYE